MGDLLVLICQLVAQTVVVTVIPIGPTDVPVVVIEACVISNAGGRSFPRITFWLEESKFVVSELAAAVAALVKLFEFVHCQFPCLKVALIHCEPRPPNSVRL